MLGDNLIWLHKRCFSYAVPCGTLSMSAVGSILIHTYLLLVAGSGTFDRRRAKQADVFAVSSPSRSADSIKHILHIAKMHQSIHWHNLV